MKIFDRTYTLPFKYEIPHYISFYLNQIKIGKRFLKFFRRYLYLILKGQKELELFKILPEHKRILWINVSAISLGDSLMDLSSRSMLKDKKVDLFTDKKNSGIYLNDQFFGKVFNNIKDVDKLSYDLIIMDSYSSRSIKIKSKVAPNVKFVGMYGYFNGPEVNRVLFSYHQMNSLLGYIDTEESINRKAQHHIFISKEDKKIVSQIIPRKFIAIAIGGEWEYKTYNKWDEVIKKIYLINQEVNIVLIGSSNASQIGRNLVSNFSNKRILNFIDRLSFNQTTEVIKNSDILICCDGGLMHAAASINAKFISLLARLPLEMLMTNNVRTYHLYDKTNVNNIESNDVIKAYNQILNSSGNHHLDV